jgi:hypothetical protein
VTGIVSTEDADGIDSVWVTLDSVELGENGGFDQFFSHRYRFFVSPGRSVGEQVFLTFRARDISGFEVQRDTYVVVVQ